MADLKLVSDGVSDAKRPKRNPNKGGSSGSGGGNIQSLGRFGNYIIENNCFYQLKKLANAPDDVEPMKIRLCTFTAKIIEQTVFDTGIEDQNSFLIEITRKDGRVFAPIKVPFSKFFSKTNWACEAFGADLFVDVGAAKPDNLRAAIQLYSTDNGLMDVPKRKVFGYLGWKKIDGEYVYLTGNGAITASGLKKEINVDLGIGTLQHYRLPEPLDNAGIKNAVQYIYDLLSIAPSKPYIGASILSFVCRAPLAECHKTDYCGFIQGRTESHKSMIAQVAANFFGDFDGKLLPANCSDSLSNLSGKSYRAKDSVFVIDDFRPSSSSSRDAMDMNGKVITFLRNAGNQAAPGRDQTDLSEKVSRYNRSMAIFTGEDLPKGEESIIARIFVLELSRGDVDLDRLTRLQGAARLGILSGLMASFIQYLAPKIDAFKTELFRMVEGIRSDELKNRQDNANFRAFETLANMAVSLEIFLDFLTDKGAITIEQNNFLLDESTNHLRQAITLQHFYRSEQDECERFLNLVRALFAGGKIHVCSCINGERPETRPTSLGWRQYTELNDHGESGLMWRAQGLSVGWYSSKDDQLWLNPELIFTEIQKESKQQGEPVVISKSTLYRRLLDRNFLDAHEKDGKNRRPETYRKPPCRGVRERYLIFKVSLIHPVDDVIED